MEALSAVSELSQISLPRMRMPFAAGTRGFEPKATLGSYVQSLCFGEVRL